MHYVPLFRRGFGVDPVGVYVAFCMNRWIDFDQTCTDTYLREPKGMVRISWPWPNFQDHQDYYFGFSVGVAFCLHSNLWTIGWALTKLAQILIWDRKKEWFDFHDPDLLFKFTRIQYQTIGGMTIAYWPIWFEHCGCMRHTCLPNGTKSCDPPDWLNQTCYQSASSHVTETAFWPGHVGNVSKTVLV